MRSFVDQRAGPFILLGGIVVFGVGNLLTKGTEWGRGGDLFLIGIVVEGLLAVLLGCLAYRAQRRWLSSFPTEVWLSTRRQFEAFDEAIKSTSSVGKALGRFRVPSGSAYVASPVPWMKIPIVLVAWGELEIDSDRLRFGPLARSNPRERRRRNVLRGLTFELPYSKIEQVEPYERGPSYNPSFSVPWTRVVTSLPAPLDDFLLSVGGGDAYAMATYREKAIRLRTSLQSIVSRR